MESGPKETDRKAKREARRRRRVSSQRAGTTQAQDTVGEKDEATQDNGNPQLSDSEEVSSLLASTNQEVQQLLKAADDAAAKIREASETDESAAGPARGKRGTEVSTLLTRTSEEVQEVLESADEAAEKIRAEARADARQFLEESRRRVELVTRYQMEQVSGFTEQVLAEAGAVQRHLEALRESFERATAALDTKLVGEKKESEPDKADSDDGEAEDLEATLRRRLGRRPRKHVAVEEPAAEEPGEMSEGARLLALRQIMAGEDSEAIEARLRQDLGIEDPSSILEWMGVQESDR